MQFGEKSRGVCTRLKALKELFSLIAFIRVLIVVNGVETSPFDILIFDTFDFRLLILLKMSGVYRRFYIPVFFNLPLAARLRT